MSSISSSFKQAADVVRNAHRLKYADVPECADEKNLQRVINYKDHLGQYRAALVPERYLLDADEANPRYDVSPRMYEMFLRYYYGITRLCQKRSPETSKMSALYALSEEKPRYGGVEDRYPGIQQCPKGAALLQPVISDSKGPKSRPGLDTVHPSGALRRNERPFPKQWAATALQAYERMKAIDMCQMEMPHAPGRNALYYLYENRKRWGDRATPYDTVPACKTPDENNLYRIAYFLKNDPKFIELIPHTEALWFDQRDPRPENLDAIRSRYRTDLLRAPRKEEARLVRPLEAAAMTIMNYVKPMLAATAAEVCQRVVRGAQECIGAPASKECADARYGLFFSWGGPRTEANKAVATPVSADEERVRAFFDAYQNSIPPPMRECTDLSGVMRFDQDMRERGAVLEMADMEWPEIEAASREAMTHIENVTKGQHVFSDDETRYLKKIVYTAQNAAVSDKDIGEITADVAAVTSTTTQFIYAFQSIVLLRYARSAHAQNMRAHGVGISTDFERFVEIAERNLREGRIGIRTMSYGEKLGGGLAYYNQQTNTMLLPPLDTNMPVLYFWMEPILHELYHSYQDATKRQQLLVESETEARVVGLKSSILMMQRLREEYGRRNNGRALPIDVLPLDATHEYVLAMREDARRMMKCQGFNDTVIDDTLRNDVQSRTEWELATQAVANELRGKKGGADVGRRWVMLTYQMYFGMWHNSFSQQRSSELGWLHFLGHTQALKDRQQGASMNMGRRVVFERASIRPGTPEHMRWFQQLMNDVIAQAAAKKQLHGVNGEYIPPELMELLAGEFLKIAYSYDGV